MENHVPLGSPSTAGDQLLMQRTKPLFRVELIIIVGVFFFLASRALFLRPDPWWDAAVYEGMGMFIFSGGETGLWEPARPPLLPLILGSIWKLGLDPQWWGIFIGIFAGVGSLIVTFALGNLIGKKGTGTLAALFLAFTPTFFLFSQVNQTESVSLFLSVASLWLFVKRKYGASGFLSGLSILTRFFQGIFAFGIFLLVCFKVFRVQPREESKKNIVQFIIALLIPLLVYFFFNYAFYSDAFYPLSLQYWMVFNTGWIFHQPAPYYIVGIFKENPLFLFAVFPLIRYGKMLLAQIGSEKVRRQNRQKRNYSLNEKDNSLATLLAILLLANVVPYFFAAHKEMRLVLSSFPLLAILAAKGITDITSKFHNVGQWIWRGVLAAWVIFASFFLSCNTYDDRLDPFSLFLGAVPKEKTVWISNPSFALETGGKVTQLMYYPLYNSRRATQLSELIDGAERPDFVFLNTCDVLPCPPWDTGCPNKTVTLISKLKKEFQNEWEAASGECEYMVFSGRV